MCAFFRPNHWKEDISYCATSGEHFVAAGVERLIYYWYIGDYYYTDVYGEDDFEIESIAWSPNGDYIATGSGRDREMFESN